MRILRQLVVVRLVDKWTCTSVAVPKSLSRSDTFTYALTSAFTQLVLLLPYSNLNNNEYSSKIT